MGVGSDSLYFEQIKVIHYSTQNSHLKEIHFKEEEKKKERK